MRSCLLLLACLGIAAGAAAQETADLPHLVPNTAGHTARVNRVLFTPDGKRLISVSNDKTIRIWDVNTGEALRVLRPPIGKGSEGALYAAALSPDGKTLAVGGLAVGSGRGGTPITLLALDSGRIERLLYGHRSSISDLAFSPDGKRLASASLDKTARIWDHVAGTSEKTLEGHTGFVNGIAWSPDGDRVVTASFDKTGRIWSVDAGETVAYLKGHEREVRCIAWARDGKSIATGGDDQSVRIWEPDGKLRKAYEKLGNNITSVSFTAKSRGVLYTRGSADYTDARCTLLNIVSGEDYITFAKHSNTVMDGAFSPDGKLAATCGGLYHEIWIWTVTDAEPVFRLAGGARAALSAAWDAAGNTIAWGGTNKGSTLRADLPLERTFRLSELELGGTPAAGYSRVQTSRDSMRLESTGRSTVQVMQGPSALQTLRLAQDHDRVRCFSFLTADRAVVGSSLGFEVYDTTTGRRLRVLQGHADEVWALAPAPNRRWVMSASLDMTVRLWDTEALLRAEPSGIGIGFRLEEGYPVVTALVPGGTAARDGRLRLKDRITAIASRGSEFTEVNGKSTADIVKMLTGPEGSLVRLKVNPEGKNDPVEYELQRQRLEGWVPSVDPLLSLFVVGNDWIAWTPEGYYAASPGGEKLMGWQVNNGPDKMATFYPLERFAASMYRPDIVQRLMETGSVERAIALADLVRGTRTERTEVTRVLPPKVTITSPAKAQVELTDDEIEVTAEAQMTGEYPVRAMRLLVDGRPYQGMAGTRRFVAPGLKQGKASWKVLLTPGRHRLVVQADSAVSQGDSEPVEVLYAVGTPPQGRLFVLAVGIAAYPDENLKLYYAAKDAKAIAARLLEKSKPKPFTDVKVRTLTDKQATRDAILKELEVLQKQMKPEDSAWVFFSGHGERDAEGRLYLLPFDVDLQKLADTGVSAQDLKAALVNAPGRVLLALDACHSGAVEVGGRSSVSVSDELARDLGRDENGVIVMCSSMARQKSLEDNENRHSTFTLALLEGLAGKGSKALDGVVYQHHLDSYVLDRVRQMTKGQQTPTTAKPGNLPPFPVTKP